MPTDMADEHLPDGDGTQRTPTSGDDEAFVRGTQEALMRVLVRMADTRRSQGRFADAERLYRRALTLAERMYGPADLLVRAIRIELARATPQKAR
jgi:hypothetical protein